MIRTLRLEGDATTRGRLHGVAFAAEIRAYTEERVRLATNGSWAGHLATRGDVLGLAEEMLPAHRAYAPDLYDEMAAMAAAAGISAAEAVIVGGFTDFVDAVRARSTAAPHEDGCTSVLTPSFYAQTWDMHDTATRHVVLLDVRPDEGPSALVFTTVGCVGQIGMSTAGLAVGIDNLAASNGRVGVTWPFVVREALRQPTAESAVDRVCDARLAGGHAYLVLDAHGRGALVEAVPGIEVVTWLHDAPIVHTNHAIHPDVAAHEADRPAALVGSSSERYDRATLLAGAKPDLDALIALTRDGAICRRSEPPWHMETSGAVIARPATRELWAVWGSPADQPYERFEVT